MIYTDSDKYVQAVLEALKQAGLVAPDAIPEGV